MAWDAQILRNLTSGAFEDASGQVAITTIASSENSSRIAVWNYTADTRVVYDVNASGGLTQVSSAAISAMGRTAAEVSGVWGRIAQDTLADVAAAASLGQTSSVTTYLTPAASQEKAISLLGVEHGNTTYMVTAAADYSGLTVFSYLGDRGRLVTLQDVRDDDTAYLGAVTSLATAQVGGKTFVFAGSGSEHGVTAFQMGNDGRLTQTDRVGMNESVPVNTVSAMSTVTIGGVSYLITGASETSSMTVMQIGANGTLTVTDHVMDDLTTRFAGLTQLQTVNSDGRSFVIASGTDQGISVYTLTAEGRLVHLVSLADTESSALTGISALQAGIVGGDLVIHTTSATKGGLTSVRVDLGVAGVVSSTTGGSLSGGNGDDVLSIRGTTGAQLYGGAGNDILTDGNGSDTLYGGSGSNIFVLHYDGRPDTIADIKPGQDLIDISAWPMIYSVNDLTYRATTTGAILTYRDETLTLISASGKTLTWTQVMQLIPTVGSHVNVTKQPIQTSDPEPVPTPGPIPVAPPPDDGVIVDPVLPPKEKPQQLYGGISADLLLGSDLNDRLYGNGGADTLYGFRGNDSLFGGDGDDVIYGGDGDDSLTGGAGHDRLYGDSGHDTIYGGSGNDSMYGGSGNDRLYGDDGNDVMYGGDGNDRMSGGAGNDLMYGDAGHDKMLGSSGKDTLYGGDGNDTLYGGSGDDELYGDAGDDWIFGDAGNDLMYGGSGHDKLYGGEGSDTLYGGDGNDSMAGNAGNDYLYGGAGNDKILGGGGNDSLYGGDGDDKLYGGSGNDALYGGTGNDVLWGGTGNDTLYGDEGNDTLYGGVGKDVLYGGDGNDSLFGDAWMDTLYGGAGNDRLYGGDGDDVLYAGSGNNTLYGGAGSDTFVFSDWLRGDRNVIIDFEHGVDKIRIDGVSGNNDNARFAALTITNTASGVDITYDGLTLALKGGATVSYDDFIFV